MPNFNTLHTSLLSRTMDKCSTWFCARSNNNNYTAAPTSSVVDAISSNSNGPIFHNANSNVTNVTPQSQGVTFFDAISSSDNGTAVTTVLAAPTTTATTYAAAAVASSGMSGTTSSSSAMSSTAALAAATSTNTSGAKPKQQINYDEISQGPGPSPSASSVTCDDTEPPAKNCYRLVMLGSSRTGKTSLVQRFLGQRFDESYTPTIEDFHRKLYRIRSEVYQLDILDTSGNHPFPAMRRLSFLTGDIFVLVFSMDSRESFEEVVRLREQILETKWSALSASSGRSKKNLPRVPMVIAGNKCDRDMKTVQVDEVMGYIAGQDSACVFVECSAKKNFRVEELFYELFMAANLPQEMAPNHHRWVSTAFGAPSPLPAHCPSSRSKKCTLSIKRRLSDACGVVAPNVRRPSIRTDLMLMRTKTCSLGDAEATGTGRGSTSGSSCVIM